MSYSCSVVVMFSDLGPDAALCQHCQVPHAELEAFLRCPHSDLYTFIEREDAVTVSYDVQCFAQAGDERCPLCPHNPYKDVDR